MNKLKFMHISDLHLSSPFKTTTVLDSFKMRELIWRGLDKALDIAEKQGVNFLFLTGDIFEGRYITVQNLDRLMTSLGSFSGLCFLIFGNHDYFGAEDIFNHVTVPENVILNFDSNLKKVYIREYDTAVYMHSWTSEPVKMPNHNFDFNKAGRNILLMHSGLDIDKGYFPEAGHLLDDRFDYIALGHIHKPGMYKRNAYYAGSLVPLSIKETGMHGAIYGELDEELNLKFIPISELVYKNLKIDVSNMKFDEIKSQIVREKEGLYTVYICELVGKDHSNFDIRELEAAINDEYNYCKIKDNRSLMDTELFIKTDERMGYIIDYVMHLKMDDATKKEIINKTLGYISGWL